MMPSQHIIISFSVSALLGIFTKSLYSGVICFFMGVLLDLDHAIEYIVNFGWREFTWQRCYSACLQTARRQGDGQFKKLYFLFHSFEVNIILWLLTFYMKNLYIVAVAVGYSTHMILDLIGNYGHTYPYTYFAIWRAIKKFQTDKLMRERPI